MADAAIPLNAPAEFVGQWFRPGEDADAASGRLLFDPVEGLTLETVSDRPLIRPTGELAILLGISVDGRLVTLRNVNRTQQNYNSRGGILTRAVVQSAFVGMHAAKEADLRFLFVEARLSHLNEWCYVSGVDLSNAIFPKGGTMTFQPLAQMILARTRGALVSVTFDFDGRRKPDRTDNPYEVALEQRAWLTIRPRRRWAYDDFDELMMRIRWFFGFAAGAQDQLLELRGEATQGAPVWILFTPPKLFAPEHRGASEMLFCRADLRREHVERPLMRWLFLCRRLVMEPVFGPYFAALATGRMYSDLRFFVFAQAAEAYHARRNPSPKRGKTIEFETRIRSLVEAMPRSLRRTIPATFPEEVKHTRNFGAHRDAKSRGRAATGPRLFALAELVKLAFDVAILRELGFTQTDITQLVGTERNRRVGGLHNIALSYLAETTPGR
jgi:hypothetical protein